MIPDRPVVKEHLQERECSFPSRPWRSTHPLVHVGIPQTPRPIENALVPKLVIKVDSQQEIYIGGAGFARIKSGQNVRCLGSRAGHKMVGQFELERETDAQDRRHEGSLELKFANAIG